MQFLEKGALSAARELIGYRLYCRQPDGTLVGGMIVETEAYTQDDVASHSYKGETARTKTMFGPAGHVYVYFTYGIHYCMNIVAGHQGRGEGVLIRALELDKGRETARQRRKRPDSELTDGPAKVCQALGVTLSDNGQPLGGDRFILRPPVRQVATKATERIGISRGKELLWRFIIQ